MFFPVAVVVALFTLLVGNAVPGGFAMALPASPPLMLPPDVITLTRARTRTRARAGLLSTRHYTFVPDDADGNECFQIMNYPGLETRSDVSKQHWGSRFKGNVEEPDLLEWNSPATKHYTLYKNRGYTIWGLDGNNDGYCHVDHSFAYSCEWPNHPGFTLSGATAFRCFSNWIKIWPTTNNPWMKMALPGNHTGEEEHEVGEGFNKTNLF
ncbi:hypothetical protein PG990_010362 [Apiospora arundinis]